MKWNKNLKIRLVGEGLFNLCYWMYFPYMAIYFSSQFGVQLASILMMIPPFVQLFGQLIGGVIADTLGRRTTMLIGASIQAVMFALFALSTESWLDYVAYVLIGIGGALYSPASDAMVADLVPDEERKHVFATFITVKNIGAVLGPVIGATLFFSYRTPLLWACMLILSVYLLIIFIEMTETLPGKRPAKKIPRSLLEKAGNYRLIVQDRVFFLYILAGVLSIFTIMQLDLFIAKYIVDEVPAQWHLDSRSILGLLLGINGLMFVVLILPTTRLLKNWRDRDVFILSCLLNGGSLFLMSITTNLVLLIVLIVTFTLGEIVRAPVINHFVSRHAPEAMRGQYMGASNMQYTIGRMLAPLIFFVSSPILAGTTLFIVSIISMMLYLKISHYPYKVKGLE